MTLRQGEYEITDDTITIKKKVLEQWRDHYFNNALDIETLRVGRKTDVLSWQTRGNSRPAEDV